MPNVATLLKDEISRISKKEAKRLVEPLRKQVASQKREISALKKAGSSLAAEVKRLTKVASRAQAATAAAQPAAEQASRLRFGADQCKKLRARLGISQESLGLLVGVSGPSVFAWEAGNSHPKPAILARIAELRSLGKREVAERLEAAKGTKPKRAPSKKARKVAKRGKRA